MYRQADRNVDIVALEAVCLFESCDLFELFLHFLGYGFIVEHTYCKSAK